MDITVYLPNDIGNQAKEAGMNLSRTLRDAVESELEHTRAMRELTAGTNNREWFLQLQTPDGEPYQGRVMGVLLCENHQGDQVILTEDERLIHYCPQQAKHWVMEDDEDALRETLRDVCDDDEYISAMAKLGYTATVDL